MKTSIFDTALVTFPRSGRHLVHQLLASGYGLPTGHIDRANPLRAPRRALVVNHNIEPWLSVDNRKCIVMIRDPFECFISFMKLEHPNCLTPERFRWALFDPSGSDFSTSKSNWVRYYRNFANYHVLSERYPNPRLIIGYKQFVENPRECLERMTDFMGGKFNFDKAFSSLGTDVSLKHDHTTHPLYDEEIKARVEKELESEVATMRDWGVI